MKDCAAASRDSGDRPGGLGLRRGGGATCLPLSYLTLGGPADRTSSRRDSCMVVNCTGLPCTCDGVPGSGGEVSADDSGVESAHSRRQLDTRMVAGTCTSHSTLLADECFRGPPPIRSGAPNRAGGGVTSSSAIASCQECTDKGLPPRLPPATELPLLPSVAALVRRWAGAVRACLLCGGAWRTPAPCSGDNPALSWLWLRGRRWPARGAALWAGYATDLAAGAPCTATVCSVNSCGLALASKFAGGSCISAAAAMVDARRERPTRGVRGGIPRG